MAVGTTATNVANGHDHVACQGEGMAVGTTATNVANGHDHVACQGRPPSPGPSQPPSPPKLNFEAAPSAASQLHKGWETSCNRLQEMLLATHREVMDRLGKHEELLASLAEYQLKASRGSSRPSQLMSQKVQPAEEAELASGLKTPPRKTLERSFTAGLDKQPAAKLNDQAEFDRMVTPGLDENRSAPQLATDPESAEKRNNSMDSEKKAKRKEKMQEQRNSTRLQIFVRSVSFEVFFGTIIVINGIVVGAEVNWQSTRNTEDSTVFFVSTSSLCSGLFLVELVMRLLAERWSFFWGRNPAWNYFDFFLAISSIFEVGIDIASAIEVAEGVGGNAQSLSNLRLLRVVRITRLVRLLRIARIVRVVKALRILVHSILSTLKSVFWAMFLLAIIIYFFAILFTQTTNAHLLQIQGCRSEDCPDKPGGNLYKLWGTIPRAMFTLFQTITNGMDWSQAAIPIFDLGIFWIAVLMFFITFCSIAVLNVVTGVFCQSAIVSAQRDRELVIQNLLENKETHISNIRDQFYKMFDNMDGDSSGTITVDEFEDHINDEKVSGFFVLLDIDTSDAWSLFKLLDDDGSGAIDAEEFVDGCLRLQGNARSIDLAKVRHENKWMMKRILMQMTDTDQMLKYFIDHTNRHLRVLTRQVTAVGDRAQMVVEHAMVPMPPSVAVSSGSGFLHPKAGAIPETIEEEPEGSSPRPFSSGDFGTESGQDAAQDTPENANSGRPAVCRSPGSKEAVPRDPPPSGTPRRFFSG